MARAVTTHQPAVTPITLVICAGQVRPDAGRAGVAAALLEGLIETRHAAGRTQVVAPLRPTAEHRYPLSPTEHYAGWTRADGSTFDPWLRTHLRMGARLLRTHPVSQTFTGTVQQWQEWSGLDFPGNGAYCRAQCLAPLHIDTAADLGTCIEPTIWVQHR